MRDPWGYGMIDDKPGSQAILGYTGQKEDVNVCFIIKVADSEGNVYGDIKPIVIEDYTFDEKSAHNTRWILFEDKGNLEIAERATLYITRITARSVEPENYFNRDVSVRH